MSEVRVFEDLRDSGLLWLINRTVFHPRGFAIGLVYGDDDVPVGWMLFGDGSEPWSFGDPEDELFEAAQRTLTPKPPGVVTVDTGEARQ